MRQSATDSAFAIPNDLGTVGARYGVATQNIFGIWSPWVTVPFQSTQPDPDLVQIVDANLVPTDPGAPATVCPATLQVDFALDAGYAVSSRCSFAVACLLQRTATRHPPADSRPGCKNPSPDPLQRSR